MPRFSGTWAALVAVWIGCAAGSVGAQQPSTPSSSGAEATEAERQEARETFQQGVQAAREAQWEDARAAFARAYELAPKPVILLNLAGAQGKTGRLVEAVRSYRRFLDLATEGKATRHRDAASKALKELEPLVPQVRLEVSGRTDADVVEVDGQPVSTDEPVPVNPGQHAVVVRRGDLVMEQRGFEVDVGQQESLTIDVPSAAPSTREAAGAVAAEPAPDAEADRLAAGSTPRDDRSAWASPWLWTGVGAAVAAGVLTGVLVGLKGSDGSDPFQGNLEPGTIEVP